MAGQKREAHLRANVPAIDASLHQDVDVLHRAGHDELSAP